MWNMKIFEFGKYSDERGTDPNNDNLACFESQYGPRILELGADATVNSKGV